MKNIIYTVNFILLFICTILSKKNANVTDWNNVKDIVGNKERSSNENPINFTYIKNIFIDKIWIRTIY